MKKYKIEVKEVLQRVVEVEVENLEDALEKVKDDYYKEEIVLDWSDFKTVEFRNSISKDSVKKFNCKK